MNIKKLQQGKSVRQSNLGRIRDNENEYSVFVDGVWNSFFEDEDSAVSHAKNLYKKYGGKIHACRNVITKRNGQTVYDYPTVWASYDTDKGIADSRRRVKDAYEYIQPEDIDNVLKVGSFDDLAAFASYSGQHYIPLLQKLYNNTEGKDKNLLGFLIDDLETLNESIESFWYK